MGLLSGTFQTRGSKSRSPRTRTFRRLTIVHGANGMSFDCSARDISESGAKIELPPAVSLPARFWVVDPHFNLTHEWLAQVFLYLTYRVAGFGGIVLLRAASLMACCALVGAIVYRRCRGSWDL